VTSLALSRRELNGHDDRNLSRDHFLPIIEQIQRNKGDTINGLQSGIKVEEGELIRRKKHQQSEKKVTGKVVSAEEGSAKASPCD